MAQNLVKTYPGAAHAALDGLSISVGKREIFGLLGPNGAGKTTAISVMATLLRPTRGSVSICGTDALRYPGRVRKQMALVPQDIALYPQLTTRENLSYFGRLYGLHGQKLGKRVAACLDLADLTEKADQRISTCSGGMKRRANLAAGMLNQPELLFLDEPTVGIDAQSRNMILERLSLLREEGTAMIYTTHYMEEAEALCSSVAILDQGQIIARGAPRELISQTPGCDSLGDVFLHLTGKQLRD